MLEALFAFSVSEFGETKPSLFFYRFWVGLVDYLFSGFGEVEFYYFVLKLELIIYFPSTGRRK